MERTPEGDVAGEDEGAPSPTVGTLSMAQVRALLRAVLIGLLGLVAIQVAALLLASPVVATTGELSAVEETILTTVATGVGLAAYGAVVMSATERDRSFLDLATPDRRDVAYAVGGSVLLLAAYLGVALALSELGVRLSEHGISQRLDAGDAWVALVLVALSYLAVAPGEELLYRNLVQKSLYEQFSRPVAVVATSVVFALVHLPAYATGPVGVGAVASLGLVFALAVGLGWLYARTDNLAVPVFAHGTFNAVQYLLLYASLTGVGPA